MLRHFRRRKPRCKTIRWSILQNFTFLIAITAVAFIIAFFTIIYIQSTMVFSQVIQTIVTDLENDMKRYFNPVSTSMVVLSRFASVQKIDKLEETDIVNILVPIFKEYKQITSARFGDANGRGIFLYKRGKKWVTHAVVPPGSIISSRETEWDDDLNIIARGPLQKKLHLEEGEWYKNAIQDRDGNQIWTDPYISDLDGQLIVTVSTSINRPNGEKVVLAFDVSLEDMPGISKGRRWKTGGVTFLMTEDKNIIGLTGNRQLTGDIPEDLKIISLKELDIPMLSNAIQFWEKPRKWKGRSKIDEELLFFGSKGERSVGTIHPFYLNRDKAIWIGHIMPTNNLDNFEHYFHQLFIIPIVFCISLLVAFLLTKKMSKQYITPLTKLAEQSTRISRLDLTPGDPCETHIAELRQLADSQEQMRSALEETTTDLQISNERLEEFSQTLSEKVEERTLELQEKSRELEELNQTLEDKVKKEVEASSRKDQIMLQSARQAQMGEMISMIAHQWRQPLSSISTVTGNMLVNLELDNFETEQFKEMLNSINDHSQFLSRTINDFRNFFKPNKSKQSIRMDSALEQTISIIGKSLSYKNIELKRDYQFETPLETYPNELTQVFLNIIKNAQDILLEKQIEYPVITITGREEKDIQVIEIVDNAGGIPDDIMDKIFEPYFSTKGEKTGTGLGLYMSKLIIEKHCKGVLGADNVESGARFTICLPQDS